VGTKHSCLAFSTAAPTTANMTAFLNVDHLLHGGPGGSKGWSGELESPFELLHLLLALAGRPEVLVPQGLHEAHNVMCRPKLQIGFINLHTAAQQVRAMHPTSWM